ncbi:MAG: glycosyl hydrolase family protein [Fibrobacteres bacterium]|nr:glycosyl hydrolase family protein [Fibrobacterota bacterium]
MEKRPALFATLLLGSAAFGGNGAPVAETIKQEFTSMTELNDFWSISTWGGDNRTHSAQNVTIADGILSLKLSGSQPGQIPVCAEIASKRSDFRYGSYSASIKTSKTPGGVVGWFTYRDSPLNEIDVEMLTKDNSDLHFTLHHIETSVDYKLVKLGFDPSAAFHEYRFDWYPDKVAYFVDGKPAGTLTKKIPDMTAAIMLNHWSGNIAGWGGPAPTKDMFMYVDWMHYSTEYPAPTVIRPARTDKAAQRPATLVYGGNRGSVSLLHPDGSGSPATLYTVQGRFAASLLPAAP